VPTRFFIALLGLLMLLLPAFATAQQPIDAQQPTIPPFPVPTRQMPEDENRIQLEKEMAKKANHARQDELKRDTDQLLKLATELKQSVDKSDENMLSLDVVRKAEEIEKLAHSVKEKMRGN